jgi:succinoglycan biosynthesis transport protein ExoP
MRDDDAGESLTEMLHLRDYWRTVRKRQWTLIATFCIIVGLVTIVTLLTPPVYEASSSVQIDGEPQAYTNMNQVGQYGGDQYLIEAEYFNTQLKKLRSRVQARAVMDRLNLWEHPEFKDLDEPVEALLDMVVVEKVEKTRLVWIYARNSDLELVQQICEAWGEVFVERNMAEINQGVKEGLAWLTDETSKAETDVKKAEADLLAFRQRLNKIALSTSESDNLVTKELERLSMERADAQAARAKRESEYRSLQDSLTRESDLQRLSLLVDSSLMSQLREKLTALQGEKRALATTYLELHPKMVEVNERIADTESQIRGELIAESGRRKALFDVATDNERRLALAIEQLTTTALAENSDEAEYNLLVSTLESKKDIYRRLIEQKQEMAVTSSLKENNVRIIDPSEAIEEPVEPNYLRNIGVAILAGLLAGVSLALFFDYMDTTIKTREEVEALGVPFLGIIPSVPGLSGEGWEMARERYLYAFKYPKSAFAEFCRNIRTNVNFTAREDGRPPRRLLITSAGPREGKTTSSINLGITFAATGRRVCLVDADLRRPSLHHAFGLSNETGFSSLITGEATAEEVAQPTPQEGLFIIPSGPRPGNPAEMLGSPACKVALDRLNEVFDLVIIESPPVVAVTDAVVLSTDVDGAIIVIKAFKTVKDLVLQAKRQLVDVDARLIGVILNDFDIQRKSYGYYYYYTYYGADREDVGRQRRASKKPGA